MIVNAIHRRSIINKEDEEDEYDVNVPFELANCYGYD